MDSVQIFKHLDIGSNKPSKETQSLIPHHMIDVYNLSQCQPSAGDYARMAGSIVTDAIGRGAIPLAIGGSTLHMDWLINGIPDAPKSDEQISALAETLIRPFIDKGSHITSLFINFNCRRCIS